MNKTLYKNKKETKKIIILLIIIIGVFSATLIAAPQTTTQSGSRSLARFFGMIQTTLIYGVYYSMMALGFALIFGAARVVNLYHGTFYLLGAYFFATFSKPSNYNFPALAFWILQILILVGLGYYMLKIVKDREERKIKFSRKITIPTAIILLAEVPLLLLFLKVDITNALNLNLFIALIISMAFVGFISLFVNKYLIDPVRGEGVTVLIVTVALAFFTEKLMEAIYSNTAVPVPSFVKIKPVTLLLGNTIDSRRLLMFFVGIILIFLVWLLMNKTRVGKGVLAVAQDKEAATICGVNPKFVFSLAIALSAILAGIAGVFTTPFLGDAAPTIWLTPLIKAFAIVILGGLGSIFGSIVAAFLLAFFEKFTKYYISSSLEEMIFLVVIILILIFRPQGLFGKKGRF